MECGLIGPPLSGKSTLFDLLTGVAAPPPGGERRTRRGVVKLADQRLATLASLIGSPKVTPATVDYVDVPGIGGEEKRQPYPANYLAEFRGADLLALVIRQFANPAVPHPLGNADPRRDLADTLLEFLVSDLATIEKRRQRLAKQHDPASQSEDVVLAKCEQILNGGQPLRELDFPADEARLMRTFGFLSYKPLLVVANTDEDSVKEPNRVLQPLTSLLSSGKRTACTLVAVGMEAEINRLDEADRAAFLADLGLEQPAAERMIRATFELLGLITFFTANEREARAWAVPAGSTALAAAGAVHADLARGFIRAEVCGWNELVEAGSLAKLKESGKLRLEGKEYVVSDGDLLNIKFHV